MIVSPICEMLGIKYPIFQGGMAWIADGKLAAAVSNGGGGWDYLCNERRRRLSERTDSHCKKPDR